MSKEWICVKTTPQSVGWTEGRIYKTDRYGRLIDNMGRERLSVRNYNENKTTFFEPYPLILENE